MVQDKRLMELRKRMNKKRPSFRRVESWRYKRVKDSWRKARGIDSKTRKKKKSGVKSPTVGYRSPKKVRGLHPSGYIEARVTTIQELNNLNKNQHAIKISGKLGAKKRLALIDFCQKRGFKILNLGISQKEIESLEAMAEAPISEMEDEEFIDVDDLEDSIDMEDKITKKQRR
ncbi:MAG: 50S ribosomal protein L32e [Promethearchaeota archaeon Loki_b32]|nr:MAG: 50S ribosomal protein L32e [Candidatus Lokiarchaeota archaeon Loki_b32]